MKVKLFSIVLPVLFAGLLFITACQFKEISNNRLVAKHGVIELTSLDFGRDRVVDLRDDWEFFLATIQYKIKSVRTG